MAILGGYRPLAGIFLGVTFKTDYFLGSIKFLGIFFGYCKNQGQNLLLN